MNAAIRIGLIVVMTGCLFGFAGCSKKADTNKSMADIQAEASKMNVEQLKAKAMEYKNAIVAKKAELEKATAKLKEIPITQQMGTEAKALQADISNISKAMADLTQRFQVYYNKLKEKGGSVAGLEI